MVAAVVLEDVELVAAVDAQLKKRWITVSFFTKMYSGSIEYSRHTDYRNKTFSVVAHRIGVYIHTKVHPA